MLTIKSSGYLAKRAWRYSANRASEFASLKRAPMSERSVISSGHGDCRSSSERTSLAYSLQGLKFAPKEWNNMTRFGSAAKAGCMKCDQVTKARMSAASGNNLASADATVTSRKLRRRMAMPLLGCLLLLDPGDQQIPDHGQNDGTEEQAGDALRNRTADDADQDNQHRHLQSSPKDERPKDIVQQVDRDHVEGKQQSSRRVHCQPSPDDQRQNDDRRSDLDNPKNENGGRQNVGAGDASRDKADPGQQRLQHRNPNNT